MRNDMEGWRFHVKLNVTPAVLRKYMEHHGYSVRTLAAAVSRATKQPCSHSSIGHLLTQERSSIGDNKARAIEEILDVPRGTLFVPVLSRVTRDAKGRRVA